MTFASRMQHKIYWAPLKRPIEWSLKTVLAPWAYIASVLYDSFWNPLFARHRMRAALESDCGRLFRNWERPSPDELAFSRVGGEAATIERTGQRTLLKSMKVLATCVAAAPEFGARWRRIVKHSAE